MSELRSYLENMVTLRSTSSRDRTGWRYTCYEQMLLDLGGEYTRVPKPARSGVAMGPVKMCFANSGRAAMRRPDLAYVEGYALSIIPVMHAWVSPGRAEAWDLTWRDDEHHAGATYFGIAWSTDYLRAVAARTGYHGIFGTGAYDLMAEILRHGPPAGSIR